MKPPGISGGQDLGHDLDVDFERVDFEIRLSATGGEPLGESFESQRQVRRATILDAEFGHDRQGVFLAIRVLFKEGIGDFGIDQPAFEQALNDEVEREFAALRVCFRSIIKGFSEFEPPISSSPRAVPKRDQGPFSPR